MAKFAIYDDTGTIIQVMQIDPHMIAAQLKPGQFYKESATVEPQDRIDVATGAVIMEPIVPDEVEVLPTLPRPEYVEQRISLYPPIQEQLDMLWHAMNADQIPKATQFFDRIAAVKAAVPVGSTIAPVTIITAEPVPVENKGGQL